MRLPSDSAVVSSCIKRIGSGRFGCETGKGRGMGSHRSVPHGEGLLGKRTRISCRDHIDSKQKTKRKKCAQSTQGSIETLPRLPQKEIFKQRHPRYSWTEKSPITRMSSVLGRPLKECKRREHVSTSRLLRNGVSESDNSY